MYTAYLFSVVLGGGLLLFSLLGDLLGGDASDVELDIGADVDAEIDAGGDHESGSRILSLRTLTYILFGFGAVGWLLSRSGMAPAAPTTVTYAALGGMLSGTIVHKAFGWLRRSETGVLTGDDSFVGLLGQITLPVDFGSAGKVVVEKGDRRRTLRALPHSSASDGSPPQDWSTVVVIEMEDGVALVAPADDELKMLNG